MSAPATKQQERLRLELAGHALDAEMVMPSEARGGVALAHGKVDDLDHPSLRVVARAAAAAGWACLRFNFPYRQQGRDQPDPFEELLAVHRAAARWLGEQLPGKPMVLAGKSQGSRTALAATASLEAAGLILLGYPLHPARSRQLRPDEPLARLCLPLLAIQGTRDPLARPELLKPLLASLPGPVSFLEVNQGSHAFAVPGGETAQEAVWEAMARAARQFLTSLIGN